MKMVVNTQIAQALRGIDADTLEMLCAGQPMDIVLGVKCSQFLDTFAALDLNWDDDEVLSPDSQQKLRTYWEDPDRDVGFDQDGCPEVDLEGLDEPRIVRALHWHQLPEHLQLKYAGKNRLGRIYVLENRLGEREYRWAECGLYEESWVYSRELTTRRDGEVFQMLVGRGLNHGQAV